jgi:dipeptidyl aminopeptidase
MWWSPGGEEVAFLRFNETDVREFEYPIYDPNEDLHAHPYPQEVYAPIYL